MRGQVERDLAADALRAAGDEHDGSGRRVEGAGLDMLPTMARMIDAGPESLSARLHGRACSRPSRRAGGWLPFDRFMALALYEPGLGYYARGGRQFGTMPASGSDFVTAPELSPAVRPGAGARRCAGAGRRRRPTRWSSSAPARARWRRSCCDGAGRARAPLCDRRPLGQRCAQRAGRAAGAVRRARALARRLARRDARRGRRQRGARRDAGAAAALGRRAVVRARRRRRRAAAFAWADRATELRPPVATPLRARHRDRDPPAGRGLRSARWPSGLQRGAAFFIDYGFPEAEYYHPQRSGGTLMCHRAHRADADPLVDVGEQGHHRARQLQRHRAGGAGRRAGGRSATPRRRASC